MEELTSLPPIPESDEPRNCPACGSRVADMASTCLMCGASLDVEAELPEEPAPPRFQIPWRGLLAGIVTAAVFIAAVGWLVRAQIMGFAPTPTPAFTATATRPPTRVPTLTATPTPTSSPTPVPPRVHQVQAGETCASVAVQYGISLEELTALNPEKCASGSIIRPGDLLLIPAATPTPGPTPTVGPGSPSPTPQCPILHVVQAGETGLGIAEKYNHPLGVIEAANPDVDLAQLQVNQVLQIPCGTPAPTPIPTVDPHATPTPIPKYASPALLSPPDGATLTTSLVPLQWTAVCLLRENEWYAVRLRRLDKDAPLESIYVKATLARLGAEYAPTADDPLREYSWEVTVVRQVGTSAAGEPRYTAASHPSGRRTFRWLAPATDATPGAASRP